MILYDGTVGRLLRGVLLLIALGCLFWFVFGSHPALSFGCFAVFGIIWYGLSMKKLKSLDSPRPR